jgi:general secretion pathway protein E
MKAEPYLLASSITAVVGQRVCRRLCTTCRKKVTPPPEVVSEIQKVLGSLYEAWKTTHPEVVLYQAGGGECKDCGGSGYLGRIAIFEVMPITAKIGRLVMERAAASTIEAEATAEGMILMKQDGYLKVLDGITTLDEVLRVAQT